MAYTVTASVTSTKRGGEQFRGVFGEMWVVKGTIDTGGNGVDGDAGMVDITVPGVEVGDIVLGFAVAADYNDTDGAGFVQAHVSADDTVSINVLDTTAVITDPFADAAFTLIIARAL